jgi:hypothetical protein
VDDADVPGHVRCQDLLDAGTGQIVDVVLRAGDAGVVDEDVEVAEVGLDVGGSGRHGLIRGDFERDEPRTDLPAAAAPRSRLRAAT